jgi:glycerol-3-phosphate dehydrogenase
VNLAELASGPPLDAVIIGGGINGCAIAEEAAARGLKVALLEASDFGFGTTWRSTKLIHGGLRYLEHGDVRLVRESLRERAWLLRTRPYLVTPQRFLLPQLPWSRRPGWQLRLGLAAYDLLAMDRAVPSHRRLSPSRLDSLAPFLPDSARGGFSFYDARVHSPERLALELALEAERRGAFIANHAAVTSIGASRGRVSSVTVDFGGQSYELPARQIVNAAGPWVDAVNEHGGLPNVELLGVTRGAHIVVEPAAQLTRDAIFSTARSDGRVFFAVPQGELLLIGTTDDRYEGAPGDIHPTPADIDYLLAEARELMPALALTKEHVRYAYAGLRPLQRVSGGPEAAISRRHTVIDHSHRGGPVGMLSIVGGKLSTFRPLAREVAEILQAPHARPNAAGPVAPDWANHLRRSGLTLAQKQHLRIYGAAIPAVLDAGRQPLCEHAGAIEGEVRYVTVHEHAVTLADIMMRRTGISWAACRGLCCAERVAELAGEQLGWKAAERKRQIKAFRAELDANLPTIELVQATQ